MSTVNGVAEFTADDLRKILFQNELSGDSSKLYTLQEITAGKSGYSFGLVQFDLANGGGVGGVGTKAFTESLTNDWINLFDKNSDNFIFFPLRKYA